MSNFEASTQYGDWKGTAALDEYGAGPKRVEDIFETTGKVDKESELLIAIEFYMGEGHFFLRGYYHPKSESIDVGGTFPTLNGDFAKNKSAIQVKAVNVKLSQDEFFKYFKRFSVVVVDRALDIVGREYEITEEV